MNSTFDRSSAPASAWRIASAIPGRLRVRHEAIRDAGRAHRIEAEIASTHGVISAHARPLTSGLLIRYDPSAIAERQLLRILEEWTAPTAAKVVAPDDSAIPPVSFTIANGTLVLAAAGELAVPALLPPTALLLVFNSRKTLREAWREARSRRIGLPTLFATILMGTLLSGQFLAAALMAWTYQFWRHRHRLAQHRLRRELLPSMTQRSRFARLCVADAEVEVLAERLRPGDRIVVEEGEMVPADGWLAGGFAVVDERLVRGVAGLSRKEAGDPIHAGSFARQGRLFVEVTGQGGASRALRLGRELAAAATPPPAPFALNVHGEEIGRKAVGPTLAIAGLGLAVGDLAAAGAILRPDYATGPGLGVSLESLRDIGESAREGVVVRDPSAFRRIAEADVFLFDHVPTLGREGLEVRSVEPLDGVAEDDLLRLAASAFAGLADDRAPALSAACASRRIIVRRQPRADYRGPEIAIDDGGLRLTFRDRPARSSATAYVETPPELLVSAEGRPVGRIAFDRSTRPKATEALRALRDHGPIAIGLLSGRAEAEAGPIAEALEVDFHLANLDASGKVEAVRACRRRGLKVAYIGDGQRDPEAARAADVAISIGFDEPDPARDPSAVLVLRSDLAWIAGLRERSREHLACLRAVNQFVLIPNLFCIAGAFFLGFTSLSSVVVTNLGTLAVYTGLPRRRKRRTSAIDPARR